VSAEGWIFMVGFRIFDVGLLVLWLVWFFRLRDDDAGPNDDGNDDDGGGPPLDPPPPSSGGGLGLLVPGTLRAGSRRRDHTLAPTPSRWRGGQPMIRPQPTRVRRPQPLPVRVR
jgi:hypothetical protein